METCSDFFVEYKALMFLSSCRLYI